METPSRLGDLNWCAVLEHHASRTPEKALCIAGGETVTYAEMATRSASLAAGLHERGIGAEIAAAVAREAFWDLDAPIQRVGAAPTPPPYAPDLERAWLPDRDDIADAIRRLAAV